MTVRLPEQQHHDLFRAHYDDPLRWPLLTRAVEGPMQRAYSTKTEWIVQEKLVCDHCDQPYDGFVCEYNFQQVFRETFKDIDDARDAAYRLFDRIEASLREGTRFSNFRTDEAHLMGSVLSFLGRWPRKDDTVILSVLRPLSLQRIDFDREGVPLDHPTYEFLIECSVIAKEAPNA